MGIFDLLRSSEELETPLGGPLGGPGLQGRESGPFAPTRREGGAVAGRNNAVAGSRAPVPDVPAHVRLLPEAPEAPEARGNEPTEDVTVPEVTAELVGPAGLGALTSPSDLAPPTWAVGRNVSPSTRRGYANDVRAFRAWCEERGVTEFPASDSLVARWIYDMADRLWIDRAGVEHRGYKRPTIERRVQGVLQASIEAGRRLPSGAGSPISEALKKTRRHLAGTPAAVPIQRFPIRRKDLARILPTMERTEQVIITFGWATAVRGEQIRLCDVEHVTFLPSGSVRVLLPKEKTRQTTMRTITIYPYREDESQCAVSHLRVYLAKEGRTTGPLFPGLAKDGRLGVQYVTNLLQRSAKAAEYPAADVARFGSHSLRRGWMVSALEAGMPLAAIMKHSGHTSEKSALGYMNEVDMDAMVRV